MDHQLTATLGHPAGARLVRRLATERRTDWRPDCHDCTRTESRTPLWWLVFGASTEVRTGEPEASPIQGTSITRSFL